MDWDSLSENGSSKSVISELTDRATRIHIATESDSNRRRSRHGIPDDVPNQVQAHQDYNDRNDRLRRLKRK